MTTTTSYLRFKDCSTESLGDYLSDYHKDIYGFRPRNIDFTDRESVMEEIDALDRYMDRMISTREGRDYMRSQGFAFPELDVLDAQQDRKETEARIVGPNAKLENSLQAALAKVIK